MGKPTRGALLTVLVMSCASDDGSWEGALTSSCPLADGTYVNEATLRSLEGDCPRMKPHTRDRLEFDGGAFISPAAVFIPCSTELKACALTVTCQVLDLQMVFTGDVAEDASRIAGVATFRGSGACKRAVYDMEATRAP